MVKYSAHIVQGKIERRILLNYRISPEVVAAHLPFPYRPKLHKGKALGGVSLIRIANVRPRYAPPILGLSSENALCRFAVEWEDSEGFHEGMYVPYRETSSRLGSFLAGTLMPGPNAHAHFVVYESFDELFVEMRSRRNAKPNLVVQGHIATGLPGDSVFGSLDEAAAFFAAPHSGQNKGAVLREFEGMHLGGRNWQVIPLDITCMRSSYFDDTCRFPEGSIMFDSALLLRGTVSEWVQDMNLLPVVETSAIMG